MEDQIRAIAAEEGWSEGTLVAVLIGVLTEIASAEHPFTEECIISAVKERVYG